MRLSSPAFFLIFCCWHQHATAQAPGSDIDVQHYGFSLTLNDADNSIKGSASLTILFLKDAPSFAVDLVRKNASGNGMLVSTVSEEGKDLRFRQDSQKLIIFPPSAPAKKGSQHTYTIRYEGIPADGLVIGKNKFGRRGFFGDNWPNRAHNWLPCADHPADKAEVDFMISAPDHYQVVANGRKMEETPLPQQYKLTHWKESVPLSTKVMVIGVADFAIDHPGDVDGIPDYSYVFSENKVSGFQSYAVAMEILPFYIKKIGPYPFEKLANVQSKTRFGGLENASAIFYFENSVGSPGIESLMAHEIAHQWFGDAVTETDWQHLWLSEGFATYMTHSYLENKYGRDTLKKGLEKDRITLINFEKQRSTPVVDSVTNGDYMQLLNPNSYEKGGWVLHMLRHKLGDTLFWKGLADFFTSYRNHNACTLDFEHTMEKAGGQPLATFFRQWLYTPGHPHLRVEWKYDTDKKEVVLDFTQTASQLFEFPLEYSIDGEPHSINIKDTRTRVQLSLPAKPSILLMDPGVNVLADFTVVGPQ
ncbi:MAG TPA: M1 family metallopeptidase [Puia sp.]|nr:M1 family metallopeptidase [Puia sp.]